MQNPLKTIVKEACFSVTGSDPFVLRSTMKYAKDHDAYFICEATVNQVNQFGGYTGMRPKDYADLVSGIAADIGFPISSAATTWAPSCGSIWMPPLPWNTLRSLSGNMLPPASGKSI